MEEEICVCCGSPTGCAGEGEDSLYIYEKIPCGPYCEDCYDMLTSDRYTSSDT